MSKLLTEQELRGQFHSIIIQAIVDEQSLDKSDVMVYPREQQRIYMKYAKKATELAQSQKSAHGEMVIGTDEHYEKSDPRYELSGEPFEWAERNTLRAEQRERNR